MYKRDKALKEVAQKRLAAIREYTELGSGIKIAMRDLEIRGAGSLLGERQHGHMEAVGYEMYLQMLEQAISEERGDQTKKPKKECLVDLPIDAHIPPTYIESVPQRLGISRRIADITSRADADDVTDELIDRFGEPPEEATALLDIALLRSQASEKGIAEIKQQDGRLLLTFAETDFVRLSALCGDAAFKGRLLLNAGSSPYLSLRLEKTEKAMDMARLLVARYGAAAG